jgi:copper chaperone NosL
MTIVETRFGAEIVTKKGKVFTFDSIECMLRYYKANAAERENFAHIMVTDALNPGKLINAESAFYLVSEKYPSPMGENLSAYASKDSRDGHHAEFSGEQFTWESLTKRYSI